MTGVMLCIWNAESARSCSGSVAPSLPIKSTEKPLSSKLQQLYLLGRQRWDGGLRPRRQKHRRARQCSCSSQRQRHSMMAIHHARRTASVSEDDNARALLRALGHAQHEGTGGWRGRGMQGAL